MSRRCSFHADHVRPSRYSETDRARVSVAPASFIPWCWSVTGRSLVRDYATKRYWGAHEEALASRELAESVLGFHLLCAEKKIPIARKCPAYEASLSVSL